MSQIGAGRLSQDKRSRVGFVAGQPCGASRERRGEVPKKITQEGRNPAWVSLILLGLWPASHDPLLPVLESALFA